MPDAYVYGADRACAAGGCMLGSAAGLLQQARDVIESNGRTGMSAALWCDQGGHAFSERDPGRQRISVTVLDDEGEEKQEARDLCGSCAEEAGLLKKRKTKSPPMITAAAREAAEAEAVDDHLMLRDLQRQLDELKAEKLAHDYTA